MAKMSEGSTVKFRVGDKRQGKKWCHLGYFPLEKVEEKDGEKVLVPDTEAIAKKFRYIELALKFNTTRQDMTLGLWETLDEEVKKYRGTINKDSKIKIRIE